MWLRSDNSAGVDPDILEFMRANNEGDAQPYGDDDLSKSLDERFSAFFGTPVRVFPVASGTAANALSLSAIAGPFDLIFCHDDAHAFMTECGATEFFTGGARFHPVHGADGRIDAKAVGSAVRGIDVSRGNSYRPGALTVTQLTEAGTAYRLEAIQALGALAKETGLRFHMDGARLPNALAFLGLAPDQMTWRAGVDVLSFGATKNGTLSADAVIFFDPALAAGFKRRIKRAGHDLSKSRFLAAQLLRYIEGGLWLRNARHANARAAELAAILQKVPGAKLLYPVEGNILFMSLPDRAVRTLEKAGIRLRSKGRTPEGDEWFRIVPSYRTAPAEVRAFGAALGT